MQQNITATEKRIESIDILRGIVMVIMALDHVRDYFHITANTDDALNLLTTTPALFFTRWITHFCAPVFVFLSGTSIYLQSLRKTKKELSNFLIKRGLWLILIEIIVIAFAWTFNPFYNLIPLQVIWAIGISMVLLGLLIYLPYRLLFILGVVIVFGHDLLDNPESAEGFKAGFWWDLFHHGYFITYQFAPGHYLLLLYPFIPWVGVMILGYCMGVFYAPQFSAEQRKKILVRIGIALVIFFVALRFSNLYGDPFAWSEQRDFLYTLFSFVKVNKYPPSLLYLCMTLGPALILLALLENIRNRFTNPMIIYGRTAFFYYVIHLYLIHLLATICFFARGHTLQEGLNMGRLPFLFVAPGEGYNLWVVYGVWLAVVIMLYPLCTWYNNYKSNHKEKWWLSYL